MDSAEALNSAVKKQWLLICTPFLSKLDKERTKLKQHSGFFTAINDILASFHPLQGSIASALVTVDPLEYIPLRPVVDDFHNKGEKKRVVLVFDDLSRSEMNLNQILGAVNIYCENMGFAAIVIAEEEALNANIASDPAYYKTIKEKTIARMVRFLPDYRTVIHAIISGTDWASEAYADYLGEKEQIVYDVFASAPETREEGIGKYHNFRSLICALKEFARLYDVLAERQVPDLDRYLYSFVAYTLVSRNGIQKNGRPCFDASTEEIRQLYPAYDADMLPGSIREWIEYGIWAEDEIIKSLGAAEA